MIVLTPACRSARPFLTPIAALPLLLLITVAALTRVTPSLAQQVAHCEVAFVANGVTVTYNLASVPQTNTLQAEIPLSMAAMENTTALCFDNTDTLIFEHAFNFRQDQHENVTAFGTLASVNLGVGDYPYIDTIFTSTVSGAFLVEASGVSFDGTPLSFIVSPDMGSVVQSCTATTGNCLVSDPSYPEFLVTLEVGGEAEDAVEVDLDEQGLEAMNRAPVINQFKVATAVVEFGNSTSGSFSFYDVDVSNVEEPSEVLSVTFSVDQVDAAGNVISAGENANCSSDFFDAPFPEPFEVTSLGYMPRSYAFTIAPQQMSAAPYVFCRLTAHVEDWSGAFVTEALTFAFTVDASLVPMHASSANIDEEAEALLPFSVVQGGSGLTVTVVVPDKCDRVMCPSETACLYASECDASSGLCLPQEVKPNAACEDSVVRTLLFREDYNLLTAPDAPQDPTFMTSARFIFQPNSFRQDLPLECAFDAEPFASCTSPYDIAGPIPDGPHSFQVRVVGNPATKHDWTIDTEAPTVYFASTPSIVVPVGTTATFDVGTTEPALFLCQFDGAGDFDVCPDSNEEGGDTFNSIAYPSLEEGPHTLQVKVMDMAGAYSNLLEFHFSADDCILTPNQCKGNPTLTTSGTCGAGYFLDVEDTNICRACHPIASCSRAQLFCTHYSAFNSVCGTCTASFNDDLTENNVDCSAVNIFPLGTSVP